MATLFLSLLIVGIVLLSWHLLDPALRIAVSEKGIRDRTLGLGWIRWDEIEGAYQPTAHDRDGLRLRLRLTRRLARRLHRRSPDLDGEVVGNSLDVRIDLTGADLSPAEVLQEILAHGGGSALRQ
jgi:hypothetical protein